MSLTDILLFCEYGMLEQCFCSLLEQCSYLVGPLLGTIVMFDNFLYHHEET